MPQQENSLLATNKSTDINFAQIENLVISFTTKLILFISTFYFVKFPLYCESQIVLSSVKSNLSQEISMSISKNLSKKIKESRLSPSEELYSLTLLVWTTGIIPQYSGCILWLKDYCDWGLLYPIWLTNKPKYHQKFIQPVTSQQMSPGLLNLHLTTF